MSVRNEDKTIRRDHRLMIKVRQIEDDIVDVCAELKEELGHYFSWRQARLLSYGAKLSSVLDANERDHDTTQSKLRESKMQKLKVSKRSVENALRMVRYLEQKNLITVDEAAEKKRHIFCHNSSYVRLDYIFNYWVECEKAHGLKEISDEELLSVVEF